MTKVKHEIRINVSIEQKILTSYTCKSSKDQCPSSRSERVRERNYVNVNQ